MNDKSDTSAISSRGRNRARARLVVIAAVSAVLVALAATITFLAAARRGLPPPITREDLATAEQRWREHGPRSYDMDLMLSGRQSGPIHVEVRDGQVTRLVRNGIVPSQRRTWDYWSVPNQLATIQQDFDSAEDPQGGFGVGADTEVDIRAEFDPEFGYPRRYYRTVAGTPYDVEWEATAFTPLP